MTIYSGILLQIHSGELKLIALSHGLDDVALVYANAPYPELPSQEKPQFWKRKPSIVKCHMLILAHLARAEIPRSLRADYAVILKKCPLFLEEMINVANLPRPPAVSLPVSKRGM